MINGAASPGTRVIHLNSGSHGVCWYNNLKARINCRSAVDGDGFASIMKSTDRGHVSDARIRARFKDDRCVQPREKVAG